MGLTQLFIQKRYYHLFWLLVIIGLIGFWFITVHKKGPLYKAFTSAVRSQRKKILIFTSSGGRGHVSAAEALQEYLGDTYEVKPVYVIREVLKDLDFIYSITGGAYHSEELYNHFLTRKQLAFVRPMVYAGKIFFTMQHRAIEQILTAYIEAENPDMVISVIPMLNGVTAAVTERLKIPFWVIPTDFDASLFTFQINKPRSPYLLVNCALSDGLVKRTFREAGLRPSQYTYVGMPVREQFLQSYDRDLIKAKYDIPLTKPVIMVMMGGRGMCSMKRLADILLQIEHPVHILFFIGNQLVLKDYLEMIDLPLHITLSVIEFTPHIAEFMAISDLFITKSGGQSVSEALYMGLPMIIDATDQALDWEQLNRTLVQKRGFGTLVRRYSMLRGIVEALLEDPTYISAWKDNIQALHLPNPRNAIRTVVGKLLAE